MASGGKRKTLKKRALKAQPASIPELRAAFERVEAKAESLRSADKTTQIKEFQKEWKAAFGKEIDSKTVDAYLHVKFSTKKRTAMTRKKGKGQKGGGTLQGAPLDYQTRPGIDGAYATYPAYVIQGQSAYNSFNQIGMKAECGLKDFTPQIPKGMGSNQAGGALDLASVSASLAHKPFASTIPSSVFQDIRSAYLGLPLPASPAVEDVAWKYK